MAILAGPVSAQRVSEASAPVDFLDRFDLFTWCSPVQLAVRVKDYGDDLDLEEDDVARAVRSRLRGARIYSPDSESPNSEQFTPRLAVVIQAVGLAFSIRVGLVLPVERTDLGGWREVTTWATGSLGTHSGDGSYVLGILSRRMDEFIDEYLRVNDEACQ